MGWNVSNSVLALVVSAFLIQNIYFLSFVQNNGCTSLKDSFNDVEIHTMSTSRVSKYLQDETNVPIPVHIDGSEMSIEERLRYLELKTNAFMGFGTDPFFQAKQTFKTCKLHNTLREYGCKKGNCPGLYDHEVCLDRLPPVGTKYDKTNPPCLIYDFGIRSEPQFGEVMATTFGCEVHAFDPSPISKEWWASDKSKHLRELPNYNFHMYGAGGSDGFLWLNEYNWGQVSILKFPHELLDCKNKTDKDTHCKRKHIESKRFQLAVKTLPTIMKELGHEGRDIDILKIDVEGSEYAFLENLFDRTGGCPSFIDQISLEWHHFNWDSRYGEGSSPAINSLVTLLHACGLKNFWIHSFGGWSASEKIYQDMNMKDVRYNLASFYREIKDDEESLRKS